MKTYFMWLKLNQPKNKAQQQLQEFAEKYNNCLIDDPELEKVKNLLNDEIKRINKEFPRCTDINFFSTGKDGYIKDENWISVSDAGVYFSFREVKRFEISADIIA